MHNRDEALRKRQKERLRNPLDGPELHSRSSDDIPRTWPGKGIVNQGLKSVKLGGLQLANEEAERHRKEIAIRAASVPDDWATPSLVPCLLQTTGRTMRREDYH